MSTVNPTTGIRTTLCGNYAVTDDIYDAAVRRCHLHNLQVVKTPPARSGKFARRIPGQRGHTPVRKPHGR